MGRFQHALRTFLLTIPGTMLFACAAPAIGADAPPGADAGKAGRLPHVTFDVKAKQVRVECEALRVEAPLEFFLCRAGTAEHEAVLRSKALPSHVHTAMLAVGLKPGAPLTFVEATEKWIAPHGPPLHLSVEFQKDGKIVTLPAYRWLLDVKTKKEPKAFTWVFTGSRTMPDNRYAADDTGYMVTLVNFDFAMIDVPELASNSNEALEWVCNTELMPPKGSKVTLVIEPAGKAAATKPAGAGDAGPTTRPAGSPRAAGDDGARGAASEVRTDEQKVQALLRRHEQVIEPKAQALREAAQAHYEVVAGLRAEQQRLITEADLLQRAIDELERKWADLTVPRPSAEPFTPEPQIPQPQIP